MLRTDFSHCELCGIIVVEGRVRDRGSLVACEVVGPAWRWGLVRFGCRMVVIGRCRIPDIREIEILRRETHVGCEVMVLVEVVDDGLGFVVDFSDVSL